MDPLVIAELAKEALRLVNNLIEGTPMEQRKAQATVWWNTWWPITKIFLPADAVKQIESIMHGG